MERWHFKCLFGWEGMREKKWWGLGVFSHPAHPKCFLPKMGRKPGRRGGGGGAQFELIKMLMCTMHMGVVLAICVFFVFFSGRCSWQFYLFIYLLDVVPAFFFFSFFFILVFFFYFFVFWFFLYFSIVFLFFIFYVLIFLWLVLFKKKKKKF